MLVKVLASVPSHRLKGKHLQLEQKLDELEHLGVLMTTLFESI